MRPSALTPLYLPKEATETAPIITNYHRINCHSGVQATLANIRMKYWFTSGRKTVQRAIYKNCFPCRRETLHPYASPPWPQLPTTRVTQARPFLCTGLDFFGPCLLRSPHPQGGFELKKHYVAIFSPNADNQPTPTLPTLTPEEERLIDFCQKHQIEWQTITELSPWCGGVYERLIGLIKHCLRRSIGRSKPTTVEFSSLLAEAERTANSRPLSYIADSDTDFFLVWPLDILHPLLREEVPQNPLDPPIDVDCDPNDADFVAPGENRLHAKVIQGLKKSRRAANTFWFEFRDGYLADLRNRGVNRKNHQYGEPTVQLGDLVLIKESDVPRCDWRLALVTELIPDQDGLIRTAVSASAASTRNTPEL
ncbi:Integrase core domain containing protein [Aphelenchoides avenae]|nr:Integrase core domain containing protein [Aphelenchus avenae]